MSNIRIVSPILDNRCAGESIFQAARLDRNGQMIPRGSRTATILGPIPVTRWRNAACAAATAAVPVLNPQRSLFLLPPAETGGRTFDIANPDFEFCTGTNRLFTESFRIKRGGKLLDGIDTARPRTRVKEFIRKNYPVLLHAFQPVKIESSSADPSDSCSSAPADDIGIGILEQQRFQVVLNDRFIVCEHVFSSRSLQYFVNYRPPAGTRKRFGPDLEEDPPPVLDAFQFILYGCQSAT